MNHTDWGNWEENGGTQRKTCPIAT